MVESFKRWSRKWGVVKFFYSFLGLRRRLVTGDGIIATLPGLRNGDQSLFSIA